MKLYKDYLVLNDKSLISPCDACGGNIKIGSCPIDFTDDTTITGTTTMDNLIPEIISNIGSTNIGSYFWVKVKVTSAGDAVISSSSFKDLRIKSGVNELSITIPYNIQTITSSVRSNDFNGNVDYEMYFEEIEDVYGCLQSFPRVCGGDMGESDFYITAETFRYFDTQIRLDSQDIPGQHDLLYSSPLRGQRTIRIAGQVISGGDCGAELGMKALYNLYSLSPDTCPTKTSTNELKWRSNCCDENGDPIFHFADVHLINSKPTVNKASERIYNYTVDLVIVGGVVYSTIESISQIIEEGYIGGIDIGQQNWGQAWDDVYNPTELDLSDTQYNQCATDDNVPINIKITTTGNPNPSLLPPNDPSFPQNAYVASNPLLMNIDAGEGIRINYDVMAGDVIEIDGRNGQIKINGTIRTDVFDIDFRFAPSIQTPNDRFVLHDETYFGTYGKQIQAEISFYPVV